LKIKTSVEIKVTNFESEITSKLVEFIEKGNIHQILKTDFDILLKTPLGSNLLLY